MYEELVKRLKRCEQFRCRECEYENVLGCRAKLNSEAADAIEELSKERKTGEWCADYDGYSDGEPVYDMWWCSECGTYCDEWDDKPTWNFCPNCGADMRPRPKEENQ